MTLQRLADAFQINPSVKIPKGTDTPFVAMDAVEPFTRRVQTSVRRPYSGGSKFMPGDVLMARITPSLENGKTSVFHSDELEPAAGSTEFIVVRGREGSSDSTFAYYLFTSSEVRNHAISQMNGSSGRQRVQTDALGNYEVDIPRLEEQRAIAATLSALDDKIESNRRSIDLSLALLDALALQVSSALPGVPLRELAALSKHSISPASIGDDLVDHFSLPAFDNYRMPDRTPASLIMSSKLLVDLPSVLVSKLNPRISRTWLAIPDHEFPALASTEFMVLVPNEPGTIGGLWLAVRDEYFVAELARRVTGTSGSHQRVRPHDALSIEVPDVRELGSSGQLEATKLLHSMNQKEVEIQTVSRLRDALLPALLSGEMRAPAVRDVRQGAS